ncbi:MAG: sodium:solute symporter family protein [Synergistaceae bacterium]|nr:sodium:solute symporter family protein [Synergistaceae bacterium]
MFLLFMLSAAAVLVAFFISGLFASRGVSSSSDFAVAGRKASAGGVSGIILGALIGGASTVGTAQMAYQWGVAAIWFSLGCTAACLVLGVWFAAPLRLAKLVTLPQFLEGHFGGRTAVMVAISTASGSFLSLVAQYLSGVALMRSIFPISSTAASLIIGALILAFVFGGGISSFSRLGAAKMIFLYSVMLMCVGAAVMDGWTPVAIVSSLPSFPFFHPLSRGAGTDLGSFASLLTGIICGQIYIQAIYSASSDETARKGCLISAALTAPMGVLGVWIGLALRASGVEIEPSQALPFFIRTYFHPMIGGLLWSGIMITVLGTAVGGAIGVSTNFVQDVLLKTKLAAGFDDAKVLSAGRIAVLIVVFAGSATACASHGALILQWSYLGMGLRAAGILWLLFAAVFRPGRLSHGWGFAAGAGGLIGTALGGLFWKGLDPLFPGLALSGLIALAGLALSRKALGEVSRR